MSIYLYIKENCPLCDDAEQLLQLFQGEFAFTLEKRDIYLRDEWLEKYQLEIPVIEIKDSVLYGNDLNYETLYKVLNKYAEKM